MCGSQKNKKKQNKKQNKNKTKTKKKNRKNISISGQKDKLRTVFNQNGENDQKSSWKIFPDFLNPNFI